jgi:hypothetical protein
VNSMNMPYAPSGQARSQTRRQNISSPSEQPPRHVSKPQGTLPLEDEKPRRSSGALLFQAAATFFLAAALRLRAQAL